MALGHESRRTCQAPDPELVRRIQTSDTKRYPPQALPRHGTPLRPGERKYHDECRENARNERRRLDPQSRSANRAGVRKHRIRYAPAVRTERRLCELVDEYSSGLLQIRPQQVHTAIKELYDARCATEGEPTIFGKLVVYEGVAAVHAWLIAHRNEACPYDHPGLHSEECQGDRLVRAAVATLPPDTFETIPKYAIDRVRRPAQWDRLPGLIQGYNVELDPLAVIEDYAGVPTWSAHGLRLVVSNKIPRRVEDPVMRYFQFHDDTLPMLRLPAPASRAVAYFGRA